MCSFVCLIHIYYKLQKKLLNGLGDVCLKLDILNFYKVHDFQDNTFGKIKVHVQ